jgi:hypothetical protein
MEPMEGRILMSVSGVEDGFAAAATTSPTATASATTATMRCQSQMKQILLPAPPSGPY